MLGAIGSRRPDHPRGCDRGCPEGQVLIRAAADEVDATCPLRPARAGEIGSGRPDPPRRCALEGLEGALLSRAGGPRSSEVLRARSSPALAAVELETAPIGCPEGQLLDTAAAAEDRRALSLETGREALR